MTEWLSTIIQGFLTGGLYAMFAAGLAIIFGVMRLVNITHGDLIVLSAFVAMVAMETLGLNPFYSLLIVMPFMFVFGYFLQRIILNQTLGDDLLPPLLVTFGISIILQNLLLEVFSADPQRLKAGALETKSIIIFDDLQIGLLPLIIFVVAIGMIGVIQLIFSKTKLGRAFRATSDDPMTAQLMGVNHKHIFGLSMATALVLVGVPPLGPAVVKVVGVGRHGVPPSSILRHPRLLDQLDRLPLIDSVTEPELHHREVLKGRKASLKLGPARVAHVLRSGFVVVLET